MGSSRRGVQSQPPPKQGTRGSNRVKEHAYSVPPPFFLLHALRLATTAILLRAAAAHPPPQSASDSRREGVGTRPETTLLFFYSLAPSVGSGSLLFPLEGKKGET